MTVVVNRDSVNNNTYVKHNKWKATKRIGTRRDIRQIEEKNRNIRVVRIKQKGSCLNFRVKTRTLIWSDIWSMAGDSLSFLLRSVYDILLNHSIYTLWDWSRIRSAFPAKTNQPPYNTYCQHVQSHWKTKDIKEDGNYSGNNIQTKYIVYSALVEGNQTAC